MPNDPRIIPLLDPTPTLDEGLCCMCYGPNGKQWVDEKRANKLASRRVRIAREMYQRNVDRVAHILDEDGHEQARNLLLSDLAAHDAALRQRDGGQVKERDND